MAKSSDKKAGKNMTVRLCAGQDIVCGGNGTLSGFSIRNGSRADIGNLKKLWKSCFDDGDSYIDGFFHTFFNEEGILLTEEEGMLAGASFFLPGNIWLEQPGTGGKWQPVRYVYALAVCLYFLTVDLGTFSILTTYFTIVEIIIWGLVYQAGSRQNRPVIVALITGLCFVQLLNDFPVFSEMYFPYRSVWT